MAKNKQPNLSNLLKTLYSPKIVNNKFSYPLLIAFNFIFVLLTAFLSGIQAIITNQSFIFNFLSVIITLPILILILHVLIYILISSFEQDHKKTFTHSLLIFSSYLTPIISIGHLLNLFIYSTYNQFIVSSINFLVFVLFIYTIILTIRNTKEFFSTTYSKVLSTILITNLFLITLGILYYLVLLIRSLQGSLQ